MYVNYKYVKKMDLKITNLICLKILFFKGTKNNENHQILIKISIKQNFIILDKFVF